MYLGEINRLIIGRKSDYGFYLIDDEGSEVLLPNTYVNNDHQPGNKIDVFIYKDSEDRIVATTVVPKIKLNEFGLLKVKEVNGYGAFLDWGLPKDLFVPYKEQYKKMQADKWYVVKLILDEKTDRLIATSKIDKYLSNNEVYLELNESVNLMVYKKTDLGYNVIINDAYKGLIYYNEIFQEIVIGQKLTGYIKNIREDNKVDVSLQKQTVDHFDDEKEKVYNFLKANEGFIGLTDKSSPKDIYDELGMSKKAFKKAIGGLYKKKLIRLEKNGTYLINQK